MLLSQDRLSSDHLAIRQLVGCCKQLIQQVADENLFEFEEICYAISSINHLDRRRKHWSATINESLDLFHRAYLRMDESPLSSQMIDSYHELAIERCISLIECLTGEPISDDGLKVLDHELVAIVFKTHAKDFDDIEALESLMDEEAALAERIRVCGA